MTGLRPPLSIIFEPIIRAALAEDLGRAGDVTTDTIVPYGAEASASLVAREPGRIAGLEISSRAFTLLDPTLRVDFRVADGSDVEGGTTLAVITGNARPILTGERVALNLLARMCGIATLTATVVRSVAGTGASVTGTRKTTPGLRVLEKYAVRVGGGSNHRYGLDDAVLIKDNHVAVAGGVVAAIGAARKRVGHLVMIEVEVDTLEQLDAALGAGADVILLDNMDPGMLAEAVRLIDGRAVSEASGGITPETAAEIAVTGVDVISLGWLTHSAPAMDIGLDVVSLPVG